MVNAKYIWFDVLTPKQAMLFSAIGKKIERFGFKAIYTTRKHDYIQGIFIHQKIAPKIFGAYGGKTLEEKLIASAKRVVELSEYIVQLKYKPLAAISFSSPDASRVAFGLAIPLILLNDTAHSKPVGKFTFSLDKYLITPSCINKDTFIQLGANSKAIHQYDGVDEVEYLSGEGFQEYKALREKRLDRSRGSDKPHRKQDEGYLVFRPEESFAAYMKNKEIKTYLEILKEAIDVYQGKILVLPRYEKQKEEILRKFEGRIEIPTKAYYNLDLLSQAEVVMTGGGTMGREAALLGIPSITYFWRLLEPQRFIERKGFPSYSAQTIEDTKKLTRKICSEPRKYWVDTEHMINKLQKPSDVLFPLMQKDKELGQSFN